MKTSGARDVGYSICVLTCVKVVKAYIYLPFPVLISLNSLTEVSWP